MRPHGLYALVLAVFFLGATPARALAAPGVRALKVRSDGAFAVVGTSGRQVRLTVDPALQRAAERLLDRAGAPEAAIVASDVRTGRILAWASRGDRDYVVTPLAPSASLFKLVTASALLEAKKVSPSSTVCYTGGEHAITQRELDARGASCTSFGEAIGYSINAVFARLASKHLDASDLQRKALDLGFAGKVPIDVPALASEVEIPESGLGLARAAAGFWSGRLTPLGALFAMQTIANDGERVRLSLIDRGEAPERVVEGRGLGAREAKMMREMLQITTRRGTCAKAFRKPDGSRALGTMPVAAKTGTLVGSIPGRKGQPRMFSWFASFAPANRPEIAVSVMLSNGLKWRTKANLVGRELLENYFAERRR
ncbi:penicillin-binding transpeptidase domain-containing protein [Chondromyces crocatus]|uniref:Penicillin-binding protein n=1 Tax=Chondromyces crocatus TaxID=52 RepID=A0A0K1EEI2_CHOCO|nr:penicillin-binding transpeptidase domain-containing protein [Chondromyces crocatus]AKT39082.1 penicillin-binding protein [Chondromyces crocatus]